MHPFSETIESQYKNKKKKLFKNSEVLPEFASLQTIKAVQSIAGNPVGFDTWFDALDWMKSEIDKKDFDIALLGCGAYASAGCSYQTYGQKGCSHGRCASVSIWNNLQAI